MCCVASQKGTTRWVWGVRVGVRVEVGMGAVGGKRSDGSRPCVTGLSMIQSLHVPVIEKD